MHQKEITLHIKDRFEIINLTEEIKKALNESGIKNGSALIYSMHTTSSIRINEDETLLRNDIRCLLESFVPSEAIYRHDQIEKRDCPPDERINGHSHLKALLLNTSETIPVINGSLHLGKWQSVFYIDFDGGNRERKILVQITGEK